MDLDDPIGHLFAVDIFYDHKNAIQKQKIYNEIYLTIIEKQTILDANEHSVYQLVELYSETDNGVPCAYHPTPKSHATLFTKKLQHLYLEHLKTLIGRAGWKVMKIYEYYTFEQERLKKYLILMNQHSRQTAKIDLEKFVPIFDEFNEVRYLKRYSVFMIKKLLNLYQVT